MSGIYWFYIRHAVGPFPLSGRLFMSIRNEHRGTQFENLLLLGVTFSSSTVTNKSTAQFSQLFYQKDINNQEEV